MPRLQKVSNITIRWKIQEEKSILDMVQRKQLKWYGHHLRMEDSRWPKKIRIGHRTVRGEEEYCNNHGDQMTEFMRSRKKGRNYGRK